MPLRLEHRPVPEWAAPAEASILLDLPFTDARLGDFLSAYYAGRIDLAALGDARYQLRCAPDSGLVWQAWILDDAGMALLYGDWVDQQASARKKQRASLSEARRAARQVELIGRRLAPRAPCEIEVLDFGLGWGYWARMALAFGYRVSGIEVAPDRLAHARHLGVRAETSLAALNAPDSGYDFINAEQVFEHLATPLATLRTLVAQLAPDGLMRIAVPDGRKALRRLRHGDWQPAKDALQPLEHINTFTPQSLLSLARAAGLEPARPSPPALMRNNCRALLAARLGTLQSVWGPPTTTEQLFRHARSVAAQPI